MLSHYRDTKSFLFQDETILSVMKYLDMQSLCRCAQVNKHFSRLASDAILYRSIDLRPYWHCVRSEVCNVKFNISVYYDLKCNYMLINCFCRPFSNLDTGFLEVKCQPFRF